MDLRRLLSVKEADISDASRVIVIDTGRLFGLVVDKVERVVRVTDDRIEGADSVKNTVSSDFLTGVVKDSNGYSLLQLLDARKVVDLEFHEVLGEGLGDHLADELDRAAEISSTADIANALSQFVTFVLDGQEYALEIAQVKEIVRVPKSITAVPRAEQHVLGLMNLRDSLLGLVKLRRMFGLQEDEASDKHRVLVANVNGDTSKAVGLVVDEVREVLSVDAEKIEHLPPLLQRRGDKSETTGVCRLDNGKRLISILAAEKLFETEEIQEAIAAATGDIEQGEQMSEVTETETDESNEIQLVVFNLGREEYGAPIHAVSEIIRVPEEMTRVPKTADFIEGMINLRGSVLPVVDLRVRFGLQANQRSDRQRILVLEIEGVLTGFVVDSVSEVLRLQQSCIESSPQMSSEI